MIVRMGLLQKRADSDNHEFRKHWREGHGALAAKLPGLRRYHQNHVVDREQRGITYARGGLDFDGFSELWFDDMPSMQAAFAAEKQVKELGEDEARLIGELKLITAIQHVVIPKPAGVPLIKRMSTLKRRPDVSAEKFQEEWFDVHSVLVKRLPQVKAYTQNLIFDRSHGRGKPAKYEELPIDGIVELGGTVRGKRSLILKDPDTGAEEEHLIPLTKHIIVFKGDFVKKGQQLTEGPVVPHEILEVCGPQELQEHLVNEVQEVYRLQGVEINDKHIEIIVRQMLRKVKITDPGDTALLWGDQVDKLDFDGENKKVVEKGGKPAEAVPVLLGITKASLETDSFISAASFQDTTRVLTEAATLGKIDKLRGFKENVIMGHLIPAGTGFPEHRQLKLVEKGEPVGAPVMEEAEPQPAIG